MRRYRNELRPFMLSTCAVMGLSIADVAAAQEATEPQAKPAESTSAPQAESPETEPAALPAEPAEPPEPRAAPAANAKQAEEIVITGSRIRTNPLEKPAPVLSLSQDDLKRAGLTSVGDLLQHLPISGGGMNTRFNSSGNAGFPPDGGGVGAGAAQVDLRYLGSKRVLVLVDGIRWVNGSSASGVPAATDLNTIPISIIDRVEVLEDGASPIYGSDAISGVVNIITRKDFSGAAANAYVGAYGQGDGATQLYDLSWGNKTERLTLNVNLSYMNQGRVSSADRDISSWPVPGLKECTSNCSSGTPQGRFVFTDPNTGKDVDVTLNEGVGATPVYDPNNPGGAGDFHDFGTADRFNYQPYNLVLTPSRRFGFFSQVEYELLDGVYFHSKALFNNRKSVNQAAPEPLFIGPEAGNGNRLDRISVDATNPYNPLGFTLDANTNPYFIGRRPIEAGPRIFKQNVDTWYLTGGLHGDFAVQSLPFYWDATLVYSQNRADQVKNNGFNSAKLQKALGPVDECNAEPGCVPFNIFGGQGADGQGTITPEMLRYVTYVQHDLSQQTLWDATANLSGDLFALPAGAVSFAAGIEHRRQDGFFQPDAVVVEGDTSDVPASPTSGGYGVSEGYVEVVVPLLADMPAFNLLSVSGAVRVSDYSTFGTQKTFKAGARWRPLEDVLLRGNYAQGFRAPGIGELFGSQARFDQQLADPCSDFLGTAGGTPAPKDVQDHCIAQGVPTDGSYEQINPQISVTTGGNRELEPETSNTYTASLVYSPSWARRTGWSDQVSVELTYYRIELDGAIQALDAQVQLDSCVRTLDPVLCAGITRTPSGVINGFNNRLTNIGGIKTSGWDLTLSYLTPQTLAGRFRVTSLSTILSELTERIPSSTGFQKVRRRGTEVGDPQQAYPRFKSSLLVDWFQGDVRASWGLRYIASVIEPCRDLADHPGLCSKPNTADDSLSKNELHATVYNDVQVGWTPSGIDKRFSVTLGVNNLFNQDPPACYSCALNGFDATTYDVPGMFGYIRAGYQM